MFTRIKIIPARVVSTTCYTRLHWKHLRMEITVHLFSSNDWFLTATPSVTLVLEVFSYPDVFVDDSISNCEGQTYAKLTYGGI